MSGRGDRTPGDGRRELGNEVRGEEALQSAVERLPVHPGLCAGCAFLRMVRSSRSFFLLCGRAATDPSFRRYPPLPVASCPGFEATATPRGGIMDR